MDYVIIGNGIAGISAANHIRRRDGKARITLVSKESDNFFARTELMRVFCGQMTTRDIQPYERRHYERMGFNRVRDEVIGLDHQNRQLDLKGGPSIYYDRLLIASGSAPRMAGCPGEDLDGVGTFVTWQDLEWMRERAKTAQKACVVGGGLIGVEVAEILLGAGIDISFIIREDYYWPSALDRTEGALVVEHIKRQGCDVRINTEGEEILGRNGKVIGLRTNHGETVDCDMVVCTIGLRPQTDWLRDSGLELDDSGGVVVDRHLRTSLQDVFAAGGCTTRVRSNRVRRSEQLWHTSRDQGRVAGMNMAGANQEYKRATFFNSARFFDIPYTTAGHVSFNVEGEHNWFQHEPGTNRTQRITFLPDGMVIGFNMLGRRWDHRALIDWIDQEEHIDYVLAHLHEAVSDDESIPAFKVFQPLTSAGKDAAGRK
ncbi:MAG: FAD-dependent oxidoreductase [Candidatus Zixiibacteriota bacterium]|nr:MAG: FAD-dependent oxidoreductase [candidate division Zixibacteria bacterium]